MKILAALCLLVALAAPARAADPAFDHTHSLLGTVLKQFVKDGRVDYAALQANPQELNRYLDQLAAVPEDRFMNFSEQEKIAFLINLYNAATLRLVIDHYPLKSIKDIGNWLRGPFDQKVVRLLGRTFSLGDVEHGILLRNHPDPRIHFALVCASQGCPPLREEPYRAEDLNAQLDDQARRFLSDRTKNYVDPKTRTLYLSKIFDWYEKHFSKDGSILAYVARYLPEESAAQVKQGGYKVVHLDYDWSLNDAKPTPPAAKRPVLYRE